MKRTSKFLPILLCLIFITVSMATVANGGEEKNNVAATALLLGKTSFILSDLTLSRTEMPVNETDDVTITLAVDNSKGSKPIVTLYRVNDAGQEITLIGPLLDDGLTATSGDDVLGDGVFSYIFKLDPTWTGTAGEISLRARVQGEVSGTKDIIVYAEPTAAELQYTSDVATDVKSQWSGLEPKAADFKEAKAYKSAFEIAQEELVASLESDPKNIFAIAGTNSVMFVNEGMPFVMVQNTIPDLTQWDDALDDGSNVPRHSDPVIGDAVNPIYNHTSVKLSTASLEGKIAKEESKNLIKNNQAVFIDPYYWQHVNSTAMTDANGGWTKITGSTDPKIDPTTTYFVGNASSPDVDPKPTATTIVDAFTKISQYGTVMFHTHGALGKFIGGAWYTALVAEYQAAADGSVTKMLLKMLIEKIVDDYKDTGEFVALTTDTYVTTTFASLASHKYAADIFLGRLYVSSTGEIFVTPSFIKKHNGQFPNSVVWLGACHSLENTTMSDLFIEKGAGAVFGFDESVYRSWNVSRAGVVFESMLKDGKTAKEAFDEAVKSGNDDGHGTKLVLAGNNDLKYTNGLLNPSFEEPDGAGSLESWIVVGDARAWKFFQSDSPTDGNTMAVVSSGLGNTTEYGALSQTFTMPSEAQSLSFYWNFYSAEFKEYCNSSFDDTFRVLLNGTQVFKTSVNDLCATSEGDFILTGPIDNTADTWKTGWKKETIDVTSYAGSSVKLQAEVSDKGDTIYDTAVLIDDFVITTN